MFSFLEESSSSMTNQLISHVMKSIFKAFPQHNPQIWFNTIDKLASDVLLVSEKMYLKEKLSQLQLEDLQGVYIRSTFEEIDKTFALIMRRIKASSMRKSLKKL